MLTQAQLTILKADILGDIALVAQPMNDDGHLAISQAYDILAVPDFFVWKSDVSDDEMHEAYSWAEMDALSQIKYEQLKLLLSRGFIDPSKPNVRAGLLDIFKVATTPNTRVALSALIKRKATRVEKLFASGGDGSSTTPATMGFEGSLSVADIRLARELS